MKSVTSSSCVDVVPTGALCLGPCSFPRGLSDPGDLNHPRQCPPSPVSVAVCGRGEPDHVQSPGHQTGFIVSTESFSGGGGRRAVNVFNTLSPASRNGEHNNRHLCFISLAPTDHSACNPVAFLTMLVIFSVTPSCPGSLRRLSVETVGRLFRRQGSYIHPTAPG